MPSPMAPLHLTLSDLERSKSMSLRFRSLISRKGVQLGPMLLLNINRKPYMESPMAPSHLTLSDLEMSKSRSLRFSVAVQCRYCIPMYLPAGYYHENLNVTNESWLVGGVFCCPSGLSCFLLSLSCLCTGRSYCHDLVFVYRPPTMPTGVIRSVMKIPIG